MENIDIIWTSLALLGVQFTWTLELAFGTPYLVSLGLSKSLTALVWLAGPLSGLMVQPLIGYYSDICTFSFGKRRPFIIGGTVLTTISIMMIAYSEWFANTTKIFGANAINIQLFAAVSGFYLLDFSINAVQASCRSLIIDIIPVEKQNTANAWAGRMIGIGNVLGYFVGFVDLPRQVPFLGSNQLQCMGAITILILLSTVFVTCISVQEIPNDVAVKDVTWYSPFVDIKNSFRDLPKPIQSICNAQFFAWMGWFPFLFYSSSWVSGVDDTRLGSMALSIFAIISLLAGFVIPLVYPLMKRFLYQCHIWALSLLFFGILFLSTIMFSSVEYKIAVICCIGISWSVTLWVPFSLIGEYLNSTPGGTYEVLNNDEIEDNVSNKQLNAGVILGIHNMYICIPQFLSTFISMIVFSVIEKDSFGWAIRMGSISMIIAGYLAWNITDVESKRE